MNKGLPRNVAFPVLSPPPREEPDDESDDDHDAEDEADPNASPMMQFLSTVTPLIPGLVAAWQGKKDEHGEPEHHGEPPAPVTVNGMAHLARVQQQLTPHERAFLAALLADERGDSVATELSVMPVEQVVTLVREHCSKPPTRPPGGELTSKQLRDRVLVLLPRLSPVTQMRLVALAPKVSVTSQVPPAEVLRSRARQIAAPPPVSAQLRGFGAMLATKAAATMSLLTNEQGQRLAILVPSFTQAALANDPDVIAMVMMWLDLEPCELARVLVASLPDLERRFAS